ncbi:syntaxin-12 isoform X1 [Myotis daubentonii]|uniref:syntaxin-12 isoform X1 n=1 Tax=Myotis daubentonii TaxID=98922 RepID=UPI002872E98B|nr:syntaxin-12 isoform X1 [Myotis daubentonii]
MSYGPLDMYRNPGPSGPPPRDFSSIIQTCSGNIQRISQATVQLKNLMSQLETKQDSAKLQENLQQLQHSTNQLAKETNELLKELGSLPLPLSTSEQRQQRLQKERLMNDFSAALNNFQAVQRKVSEKEKESIARARAGSRLSAEERQREEQLVSFDSHEEWNQMQSQEDEVAITEQDLELIKERETAIRQLEADILDVNQIFKDLAMMIHDQGDLIEKISQEDLYPGACPDGDCCYLRTYYVVSLWKVIASELSPTELFSRANACWSLPEQTDHRREHTSERPGIT